MPSQPLPNALRVIGAIATKTAWASAPSTVPTPNVDTVDDGFELGRLMRLSREQRNAERQSAAITQEVQLRAKSAFGTTKRVIGRFGRRPPFFRAPAADRLARIEVLSIHHCSQSICPLSSSGTCNSFRMQSQVPSWDQRR